MLPAPLLNPQITVLNEEVAAKGLPFSPAFWASPNRLSRLDQPWKGLRTAGSVLNEWAR
jgi:hypothetical protein